VNFLQLPEDCQRSPEIHRWARLRVDIATTLRRGGWYPVLSVGEEEAVLQVRGSTCIVARDVIEIRHTRPETWSVVPAEWGGPYIVCPDCAERVRSTAVSGRFACPRCHGSFAITLERDIAS
jgi:hypothetical protein